MIHLSKKDTITKEYMRNPVIFADIFNKFLYNGKQVINSKNLTELDTTEIALPYGENSTSIPEQKYRDVLKLVMTDGNVAYCILGVENQSDIHYAMPVKNMLYDAIQLAHQISEAAQSHRRKSKEKNAEYKPSSQEYLSGFYKTDKLIPVVTLTIFWGADKWDAPLSLKEMYATTDETIMQYVPDYKVNLISPEQMTEKEIGEFQTSLKEVMLYIKYSKDKRKLYEVTQTNSSFRSLDRTAAEVINAVTNSKLKYPEGKGQIDMCIAIEEMRMDSRLEGEREGEIRGKIEGRIEGAVTTYKEVGFSLQDTIQHIVDNYNLSLQEAEEKVTKYWQE